MAGNVYFNEDGWSQYEISAVKLSTSYKPPFYVKIVHGIYAKDEELCFSAGDEYIILHKLEIKSVIATTIRSTQRRISLKIPLDYTGKFHPIGAHEALPLQDIVTDLPKDVRLGNSRQHSSVLMEKLGHNNHCTLRLSKEVLDDYFLGKSKDGQLVIFFPQEIDMNFLVKKVNRQNVKNLSINMADLKYDIFIQNKDKPTVQVMNAEDAVQRAPPRPPKPKPSSGSSPKSPVIPSNQISPPSTTFSYEVTPLVFKEQAAKPKPQQQLKFNMNHSVANPQAYPLKGKVTPLVSPKPWRPNASGNRNISKADPMKTRQRSDEDLMKTRQSPADKEKNVSNVPEPPGKQDILSSFSETKTGGSNKKPKKKPKPPPLPSPPHPTVSGESDPTRHPAPTGSQNINKTAPSPLPPSLSPHLRHHDENVAGKLAVPIRQEGKAESSDSEEYEDYLKPIHVSSNADDSSDNDGEYEPVEPEPSKPVPDSRTKLNINFSNLPWNRSKKTSVPTQKRYRSPHDKLPMPQLEPPTRPPFFDRDRPRMPPASSDSNSDDSYDSIDDDELQQPPWSGQRVPPNMPFRSHTERSNDFRQPQPIGVTNPNPHQQIGVLPVPLPMGKGQPSILPQPAKPQIPLKHEKFPSELCHLSVEDIADTLLRLDIPEDTVDKFRASEIDGQIFVCINDSTLDQLGVTPLHKLKIIKFKNGWRPYHT